MSPSAKSKVIAVIPARGGSKGLPDKNIRPLCGKPLIAYTIEAALSAVLIDRVVVSTDDEQIAEIAKQYGAEVPFLRPAAMAGDNSGVGEAINYTVHRLAREDKQMFTTIVTLYPTHPFRAPALLDFLVKKAVKGYSPVHTVREIRHNAFSTFVPNGNQRVLPLLHPKSLNGGEMPFKRYFRFFGLFSAAGAGPSGAPFLYVVKDTVCLVDIDTLADFYLAEEILEQGLFDFNTAGLS